MLLNVCFVYTFTSSSSLQMEFIFEYFSKLLLVHCFALLSYFSAFFTKTILQINEHLDLNVIC